MLSVRLKHFAQRFVAALFAVHGIPFPVFATIRNVAMSSVTIARHALLTLEHFAPYGGNVMNRSQHVRSTASPQSMRLTPNSRVIRIRGDNVVVIRMARGSLTKSRAFTNIINRDMLDSRPMIRPDYHCELEGDEVVIREPNRDCDCWLDRRGGDHDCHCPRREVMRVSRSDAYSRMNRYRHPDFIARMISDAFAAHNERLMRDCSQSRFEDIAVELETLGIGAVVAGNGSPSPSSNGTASLARRGNHLPSLEDYDSSPDFWNRWQSAVNY
jgi:hypothetical protein